MARLHLYLSLRLYESLDASNAIKITLKIVLKGKIVMLVEE